MELMLVSLGGIVAIRDAALLRLEGAQEKQLQRNECELVF